MGIKLRKGCYLLLLMFLSSVVLPCMSGYAWGQATHAYIGEKSLGLNNFASYHVRLGSVVPDFFYYLVGVDLINQTVAEQLHGFTHQSNVFPNTTYFYELLRDNLDLQDQQLRYFVEGVRSHLYADIKAHDPLTGYVEGSGMWVDIMMNKTGITDRMALHGSIELAVDSLVINVYGDQSPKLIFSTSDVEFLEQVVGIVFQEIGITPTFDVSSEFRKYLFLLQLQESVLDIYGDDLIRGKADPYLIEVVDRLSTILPQRYAVILQILVQYPSELYTTLTTSGIHWKEGLDNAVDNVVETLSH